MGAFSKREGFLAQKPVTLPATIALLLIAAIPPTMGICHKCKVPSLNLLKFVVNGSSIMEHISNFCQCHVGPRHQPGLANAFGIVISTVTVKLFSSIQSLGGLGHHNTLEQAVLKVALVNCPKVSTPAHPSNHPV